MTSNELNNVVNPVENDDGDNMCGICLEDFNCKLESDIIVTLKCKHRYCYECICNSYLKSKEKRQCPYCRKKGGYLPLPESATPIKFIHKEYVSSKLPPLPLMYCLSHYKKTEFVAIAKKLGIPLFNNNNKKKLEEFNSKLYENYLINL